MSVWLKELLRKLLDNIQWSCTTVLCWTHKSVDVVNKHMDQDPSILVSLTKKILSDQTHKHMSHKSRPCMVHGDRLTEHDETLKKRWYAFHKKSFRSFYLFFVFSHSWLIGPTTDVSCPGVSRMTSVQQSNKDVTQAKMTERSFPLSLSRQKRQTTVGKKTCQPWIIVC